MTDKNSQNLQGLKYLKRKYVHQYDNENNLARRRADYKNICSEQTSEEKQKRLVKRKDSYNEKCSK